MTSVNSPLNQYNHFETQTLKVVLLLNFSKVSESMNKNNEAGRPNRLNGLYEQMRTLADRSRKREHWKSHFQKVVKGKESVRQLVREEGLLGLHLYSEEMEAFHVARSSSAQEARAGNPKGQSSPTSRQEASRQEQPGLTSFSLSVLFPPTNEKTASPGSGLELGGPPTPPAVFDQETEVCQSNMASRKPHPLSTEASERSAERDGISNSSSFEDLGRRENSLIDKNKMEQITGNNIPKDINSIFEEENANPQFESEQREFSIFDFEYCREDNDGYETTFYSENFK